MNIGKLRNLVEIHSRIGTQDAYGADTNATKLFQKAWVDISPLSTREIELARSFSASVSHKLTARFMTGLNNTMVIKFGSRTFSLNGFNDPDGRRREINLFVTEVQ